MALIRFKTRSLIRRFGTGPVDINDSLAKRFLDRGQAIHVRDKTDEVEEEAEVEEVGSSESQEEVEEEKVEVKIKKKRDKGK